MRGVKKPIKVYKITEVYLNQYSSITDAAKELNLNPADVARVVRGDRSRVNNYTFKPI